MKIRRWFADTVFLKNKHRFSEYILESPSAEVRGRSGGWGLTGVQHSISIYLATTFVVVETNYDFHFVDSYSVLQADPFPVLADK